MRHRYIEILTLGSATGAIAGTENLSASAFSVLEEGGATFSLSQLISMRFMGESSADISSDAFS